MQLSNKRLISAFTFYLLLVPFQLLGDEFGPFEDKSLPEERKLNELYHYPMFAISDFLRGVEQYCHRLPSEKEFEKFILNGEHKSIQCSKIIKTAIPLQRNRDQIGKNLPYLPDFLNRNQYQVYSDTKKIFVILKHNPSEWKYKYFKPEEYDFVIHCTLGHGTCKFNRIKDRAKSCRASKAFSKNCYFNDKKVIDY
ncbi:MAG: hypothetical protein NDI69_07705 [Bacteriovoracaceae bacterium]|nr:hypothetical protein [Bacteriovoracaceae bacterium]